MAKRKKMCFYRIIVDEESKHNTVILKEKRGDRFLPIYIGSTEALAIESTTNGDEQPRPMTHDLMVQILGSLNIEILGVMITKIVDSTFYADIKFRHCGTDEKSVVDARPSDALCLAIRSGCPIYCAEELLEEASVSL